MTRARPVVASAARVGALLWLLAGLATGPTPAAATVGGTEISGLLAIPALSGGIGCLTYYQCSGTYAGTGTLSVQGLLDGQPVEVTVPTGTVTSGFDLSPQNAGAGHPCYSLSVLGRLHFGGGALGTYGTAQVVGLDVDAAYAGTAVSDLNKPVFALEGLMGLGPATLTLHLVGGSSVTAVNQLPEAASWAQLAAAGTAGGACSNPDFVANFDGNLEAVL